MGEYSVRWGEKVSGWWVDGCGHFEGCSAIWNDESLEEFSAALKSGNPKSVVCYNPQNLQPYELAWVHQGIVHFWTNAEDYTAGECFVMNTYPHVRWINGIQWNMTIYLGEDWARPEVKYADSVWIDFLKNKVFAAGGTAILDLCIRRDGSLEPDQLKQLAAIKAAIKG